VQAHGLSPPNIPRFSPSSRLVLAGTSGPSETQFVFSFQSLNPPHYIQPHSHPCPLNAPSPLEALAHYEACHGSPNMDNWGDPWADNAKSPTKESVTAPLPPTFKPVPALFNGFVDDAGWGNDEGGFGRWDDAVVQDEPPHAEVFAAKRVQEDVCDTTWDEEEKLEVQEDSGWAAVLADAPGDEELVLSETSDTSTMVQANSTTDDAPGHAAVHLPADDDSSARASMTTSETSHNDVPVESPRTSYEEERGAAKAGGEGEVEDVVPEQGALARRSVEDLESIGSSDNTLDEVSEDIHEISRNTGGGEDAPRRSGLENESSETPLPTFESPKITAMRSSSIPGSFAIDADLLGELFPPYRETKKLDDAPDDPIYSTSGRKAWYRLTRKQTLREYNNGNDDDNYIRVTWANSHIRSEVNSVVGRWAREDRVSGTGPGARASFYWDSPAPTEPVMTGAHMRQRSSLAMTSSIAPNRESIPALDTHAPAAFNWSSASASIDPWQQPNVGIRAITSPIAPLPHPTAVRMQETRAVSLDLASHTLEPAKHAQDLPITDETPAVARLTSPPITNTTTFPPDPWTGNNTLDAPSTLQDDILTASADDEDEWGEMVSSPTMSTFTTTQLAPQVDARHNILSALPATPQSRKSVAIQDQSPNTMHAASIVRLRSTISPTSATFKAHNFLPLGAEQGPIGPGILKPAKRSVSVTPKKVEVQLPDPVKELVEPDAPGEPSQDDTLDDFTAWQISLPRVVPEAQPAKEASLIIDKSDDLGAWQTSLPDVVPDTLSTKEASILIPSPILEDVPRPSTPPSSSTQPPPIDPWSDADFSIFESSLPVSTPPRPQPKPDPSDPFSVFETRARSVSVASSAKTFSRSPPRKVSPTPVLPLSAATSSAQRRKMEEERVVGEILGGLPDLRYMLL
jgi:hypothetical protein